MPFSSPFSFPDSTADVGGSSITASGAQLMNFRFPPLVPRVSPSMISPQDEAAATSTMELSRGPLTEQPRHRLPPVLSTEALSPAESPNFFTGSPGRRRDRNISQVTIVEPPNVTVVQSESPAVAPRPTNMTPLASTRRHPPSLSVVTDDTTNPSTVAKPLCPPEHSEEVLTPYKRAAETEGATQHFVTQVLAILERLARQRGRQWFFTIAEFVIPLIFIVLVIILNVAFGTEKIARENFMQPDFPMYQLNPLDYRSYVCYRDADRPINGISECSALRFPTMCDGDESGIPVSGLCYLSDFESATSAVAMFLEALTGSLIALPPLDAIIVHQWLAKKAGLASDAQALTTLSALANAGLGASGKTRYDSITYSGKLYFAPASNIPADLVRYLNTTSTMFRYVYGGTFASVADAESWIKRGGRTSGSVNSTWGLVVVQDIRDNFNVDLHLHGNAVPSPRPVVSVGYTGGFAFDGADMYMASGALSLQKLLYEYFMTAKQDSKAITSAFDSTKQYPLVVSMPTIATERKYLLDMAAPLVAFIVVLAFLYPFSQISKRIVLERELRIREAMLIMGLRPTALSFSVFLVNFLQNLLLSILITLLLCTTVVTRSNAFTIFLVVFIYSLTVIPLARVVAAFFSKARLAALMSPLVYFILSTPIFTMQNAKPSVVLGLATFAPTCFAALLRDIFELEAGRGFAPSDFAGNAYINPQPYKLMLMLMADFFIYTGLAWYLTAVIPQEWGANKHPLFFLRGPYRALKRCCGTRAELHKVVAGADGASSRTDPTEETDDDGNNALVDPKIQFDAEGNNKHATVRLNNLRKVFGSAKKKVVAVSNFSLQLYDGEITVLLGSNGAGKSTTLHMITGMTTPTSGDCLIAGSSVRRDLAAARQHIGYCPQHNILWPNLTAREHLEFFGKIKGLRGVELEETVVDLLRAVDLEERADYLPTQLSGGQKRKLSVAIAFAGRNRIIMLDEPTSGMDAAARRHTWSLLRALAENHTILLTTHHMDEADLLGDQIVIMNEGKLRCAGGSLFLRTHTNVSYSLHFDIIPTAQRVELANASKHEPCGSSTFGTYGVELRQIWAKLSKVVRWHVPSASLLLQTDSEVNYSIPLSSELALPSLLSSLEREGSEALGVEGYALMAPTMEDVFLDVVGKGGAPQEAIEKRRMTRASVKFLNGESRAPDDTSFAHPDNGDFLQSVHSTENSNEVRRSAEDETAAQPPTARSPLPTSAARVAAAAATAAAASSNVKQRSATQPTREHDKSLAAADSRGAASYPRKSIAGMDLHLDQVWSTPKVTSHWKLWGLQMVAMLYKRLFYSIRDYRMLFFQIVCPVLCILLAMLLQLVNSPYTGVLQVDSSMFMESATYQLSGCASLMGSTTAIGADGEELNADVTWKDRNFMNSNDMSLYLLDSWFAHRRPRFAATQCNDRDLQSLLAQISPQVWATTLPYVLFYNTSSKHSLPYALHLTFSLFYAQGLREGGADPAEHSPLRFGIQALPIDQTSETKDVMASILISVIVLIPFTFLPANPVAWVVKERELRAHHLQKLSGLRHLIYWFGNFVFDFGAYLISMFLVIIIFAIFQRKEYAGSESIGPCIVAFLLYGVCSCWAAYAVSFPFREHTSAQMVVLGISFISGFVCVILVFVLNLLDRTEHASQVMRWIFRVIPSYAVGEVILNLALLDQKRLADPSLHPWSLSITAWADIYMAAEIPVLVLFTLFWDHPSRRTWLHVAWRTLRCSNWRSYIRRSGSSRDSHAPTASERRVPSCPTLEPSLLTEESPRAPRGVTPGSHRRGGGSSPKRSPSKWGSRPDQDEYSTPCSAVASELESIPAFGHAAHTMLSESIGKVNAVVPILQAPSPTLRQRRPSAGHGGGAAATPSAAQQRSPQAHQGSKRRPSVPVKVPCAAPDEVHSVDHFTQLLQPAQPANPHEPFNGFRQLSQLYPAPRLLASDYQVAAEDGDVQAEREMVYEREFTQQHNEALRFVDLRKVYRGASKAAVRSLTFEVMPGEVFGFLGTNGAGKSTALSVLSQERHPTSGRAYVCGHDVLLDSAAAMRCIGYCPQFDATFDMLTVEEHLRVFAGIRGVRRSRQQELVNSLLMLCELDQYRRVLSCNLSGGNRRKLSMAIALLGAPRVVCLDEPTSGVDPIARRRLWHTLDRVSSKCAILLTTHHLEEVEAMADCVAIMVDGGLRCIGDLPHLKRKYGSCAYELRIRVNRQCVGQPMVKSGAGLDESSMSAGDGTTRAARPRARSQSITYNGFDYIDGDDELVNFMETHFPSAVLTENVHDVYYVYSIPATARLAVEMASLQRKYSRASLNNTSGAAATASTDARSPSSHSVVRLSELFSVLQHHRKRLGITEYSVSQVSLDEVFLRVCAEEPVRAPPPVQRARRSTVSMADVSAALARNPSQAALSKSGGADYAALRRSRTAKRFEEHKKSLTDL